MIEHERVTQLAFMQVGRTVEVRNARRIPPASAAEEASPAGWCRGRAPFRGPQ